MPDSHISVSVDPRYPPPFNPNPPRRVGFAVACLVLGIVSVFLSLFVVGALVAVAAIIFGVIHLVNKRGPAAMAWWGISLSLLAIVASVGMGIIYYKGFHMAKGYMTTMMESVNNGSAGQAAQWEGVLAPEISVTTLDGKNITLSQLRGKRVILDFWATWCPPCVAEIPHFTKLHAENSRDDLVIISISQEPESVLKKFAAKHKIPYALASATGLPAPYGEVTSFPTTFFIDRNGVIQSVAVGGRDFEQLKSAATAKDFEGEVTTTPREPVTPPSLEESATQLAPSLVWSNSIPSAQALCAGDWDSDGVLDILVSDSAKRLHVLGIDGKEKKSLTLPAAFSSIESGRSQTNGFKLLGYINWQQKVTAMDRNGKVLWHYTSMFGVDGAHWGDLDGDGADEMIVGMNGLSGLHAVTAGGKNLWKVSGLANVWNQAVIPAKGERAAQVFVTEAGGSIRVFDGKGNPLRTLRPNNEYCTQIKAAVVDGSNTVQLLVRGQSEILALDPTGQVAWSSPAPQGAGNAAVWQNPTFAAGDLNADGISEWVFQDGSGKLILASPKGEQLGSVSGQIALNGLTIVPDANGRGLLVVLSGGTVRAFSFE